MTPIRMRLLLGLLLALALAVAGCGDNKPSGVASLGGAGSATSTTTTNARGSEGYDLPQALVFTRCMRQHGYDLPDPQTDGNTVGVQLPNYQGQRAPKYQAAWQACRRYAPNGGQARAPRAQDVQAALAFARCLRQHGINLPDPQVTAEGIDQPPPPACTGTTRGSRRRSRPASSPTSLVRKARVAREHAEDA